MSEQNDNNEQLNSQDESQNFVTAVEKDWDGFWSGFCAPNARLLLGSMASGSMLGLFFALFLSMIITPIMFYVFNSAILDYDSYFKPQLIELSEKQKVVTGQNNAKYTITRNPEKIEPPAPRKPANQMNASEKDASNASGKDAPNASGKDASNASEKDAADSYSYTIYSMNEKLDLYTVIIREEKKSSKDNDDNKTSASSDDASKEVRGLKISVIKGSPDNQGKKTSNDNSSNEIQWFETSNIAFSNSIFEIVTKYKVLKSPSYPTSITAFISWLKEYGKDKEYLNLANVSDTDNQIIASHLERILEKDWKFQKKNDIRILFFRSINGGIQFLCVLLFNAILILLIIRNLVVLYFSPLHRRFEKKNEEEKITTDKSACDKKMIEYCNTWGMESPMLAMWRSALSRDMKDPSGSYLTEISERINNTIQSSFSYIMFMSDTILALGFVGTIIGIGKTMLNTSAVISNELGKQQSRISEVSLDLAFAFDTTLVALLLSMVIGFFITVEKRQEEMHILNIAEDICNQNVNNSEESK